MSLVKYIGGGALTGAGYAMLDIGEQAQRAYVLRKILAVIFRNKKIENETPYEFLKEISKDPELYKNFLKWTLLGGLSGSAIYGIKEVAERAIFSA